jgi:hypothetical protein
MRKVNLSRVSDVMHVIEIGSVRSIVVPEFHSKTIIQHSSWLPTNVKLVVGYVTQVTKEQVDEDITVGRCYPLPNSIITFDVAVMIDCHCKWINGGTI